MLEYICTHLWWRMRGLKARIHCWYIRRVWMPRHQVPELSEKERQEASVLISEILHELKEEEDRSNI